MGIGIVPMPENGDAPVDGADLIGEAADSDADLDIAPVEPAPLMSWVEFLHSCGLYESHNADGTRYELFSVMTQSPQGFIYYLGGHVLNQKCICKQPGHGQCVTWVKCKGYDHHKLLRALVGWLGEACSSDAHKISGFELKKAFGRKPKPLRL